MASDISVNTGLGNGLLPGGTKPLTELMLTYHQRDPLAFVPDNVYLNTQDINLQGMEVRLKSQLHLPGDNGLNIQYIPWNNHIISFFNFLLFKLYHISKWCFHGSLSAQFLNHWERYVVIWYKCFYACLVFFYVCICNQNLCFLLLTQKNCKIADNSSAFIFYSLWPSDAYMRQ